MEFKEIIIKDFLSYYGDNSIEFSDMTTIIIGQNNTGKSKLFDAINFAIYGRIFHTGKGVNGEWIYDIKEISDFILNNRKKIEALEGKEQTVDSGVQLNIELDTSFLNIDRKVIYKNENGSFKYDRYEVSVSEIDKLDGHIISSDSHKDDANSKIEQYFSRSIKDYFLFQGEAASKIMQLSKGGNFSKAVREIARLSVFEDAKEIADGYSKHVNNILVRKINKNKELAEKQANLQKDLDAIEEDIKKYTEKRNVAQSNIDAYKEQLNLLEPKLSQMKEFEEWFKRKNELESNIQKIKKDLKNANSEKTEIAEDAVFYKITDKINSFRNFYHDLENKGEVPPSIPRAEIVKALDYCRCTICDTDLSEGSPAREFVKKRLPKCDTDKLGNYLRDLNIIFGNMIDDNQRVPQKLEEILDRKRKLEERKKSLLEEKEEIASQLESVKLSEEHSEEKKKEIEELRKSINHYRNLLERAKTEFDRNDALIEEKSKTLQNLRTRQVFEIGNSSNTDITDFERFWSSYAPKVAEAMEKLYKRAHDTAYNKVEEKADEYYRKMTQDNAGLIGKIKIDTQNSEIYTVDENGDRILNINQGNRISIQLAVIAGILTIAQEEFGQQYPFVTDAPVSALGGDNKLNTIQTMIDAFEQSIIVIKDDSISKNKTNDEIRNLIQNSSYVGIAYELSMSDAQTKNNQHTVIKRIKG